MTEQDQRHFGGTVTVPIAAARAAAAAAFTDAGGNPPEAFDRAITAYERRLAESGVIPSGDPKRDAEAAARRLAEASDNNLFTGTPGAWAVLLTETRRVWHAYQEALARLGEPARSDLSRDRETLLNYINLNTRNP